MMFQLAMLQVLRLLILSVQPRAISFSSSGTTFFIYDGTSTDAIRQYSLSSPFDLNGAVLQKSYPESGSSLALNTIEAFPQDLEFSSDGSKFFITGDAMDKVQEFTLSTPFDLSNVTHEGGHDISDKR